MERRVADWASYPGPMSSTADSCPQPVAYSHGFNPLLEGDLQANDNLRADYSNYVGSPAQDGVYCLRYHK